MLAAGPDRKPLLDQAKVIAEAKAVTAEKYPDADTVLVSEYQHTEFKADGSHDGLDDEYIKVLTEAGRKESRERSMGFDAAYGGLEVLAVEVIKPDGTVVKHDPAKVAKEQVDRADMAANIYDPNQKMVVTAVPEIEIGDTVHFLVHSWESKARMQGAFADTSLLESTMPMLHVTYEYVGPKDHPLRSMAVLGEKKGTVKAEQLADGDTVTWRWTGTDIPQLFPEAGMPSITRVAQRLLVSTVADWKEISRWYHAVSAPHLAAATPEMKAKVDELTKGLSTDEEKVRAIFKFVSQEIRYMGITTEKDAPGYEPHDVGITFGNRYGVCRDKAALLVSMLQAAGMQAYPVLINAGDKLDREVPSIGFNHAITAARGADGKYILMDSTDENTADLLPQYQQDKSYLVATAEGETLMTSPAAPVSENMAVSLTEATLAEDGSATGTTTIDFHGINDNAYRGSFAQAKPADLRRGFERMVKGLLPGGKLVAMKLEPEDMLDTSKKLRLTLSWSVPSLLVSGGGAAQLEVPFLGYELGFATQMLGKGLQLDKRRFPLVIETPCGTREDVHLKLPASLGAPLALPKYGNAEHADFSIVQAIDTKDGELRASIDLQVKSPEISPEAYLVLKGAMARFEADARQQPVFARTSATTPPPPPSADVEVVRSATTVHVDAPGAWTTRQEVKEKVLTVAGKKANSELHIDFNPKWETVAMEYARVTQKDGTVRELKPEEVNIIDAGWVAAAPRYPAAKTMAVSLPGVEVGSTIEYAMKRTTKGEPILSGSYAFASNERVDDVEFSYDLPADMHLALEKDFPSQGHLTDVTKDGRRLIDISWHGIEPRAREGNAPPAWTDAPDFVMSSTTWPDYARAVGEAVKPAIEHQDAAASKGRELAEGKATPAEKITAIRDFVARQVRQAGPDATDLPIEAAYTPADVTLKDGYGHMGDRSILLCAMLRGAGFDADVALAAWDTKEPTIRRRHLDFPSNGYLRGPICRVKHPETGEWLPLDAFSQYAPLGATSLDGEPGYAFDGTAFTWAAPKGLERMQEMDTALAIEPDGTATITVTQRHRGLGHASFVQHFTEMTPEERSRTMQALVSGIAQGAKPVGDLVTDFAYPGTLRYTVKVPHFAVPNAGGMYFDLPSVPMQVLPTDAEHRERALFVGGEQRYRLNWTVSAPAGLVPVMQPESLDWKGPGSLGSLRFISEVEPARDATRLVYALDADLSPAIVPTGNYAALLELNRRFRHPAARRVLLQPAKADAQATSEAVTSAPVR
jgi:transglutaminase-like putative cysteine protease